MACVPSLRPGAPQAMWTRPSTPMTSADRPMTIRPLASGFSGWRISRTATAPSSIGTSRSSRPKAPVTSISTRSPTGPRRLDQVPAATMSASAEQQQGDAVLAVGRVEALRRRVLCRGTSAPTACASAEPHGAHEPVDAAGGRGRRRRARASGRRLLGGRLLRGRSSSRRPSSPEPPSSLGVRPAASWRSRRALGTLAGRT